MWNPLAERLDAARIVPPLEHHKLDRAARVAALDAVLADITGPVVLVAPSAGVATTVHWAQNPTRPIRGALLATPADVELPLPSGYPTSDQLERGGWTPVPRRALPFPSIVAASRTDQLAGFRRVAGMAEAWGSRLVDLGDVGHLNPAAGYGPWPGAEKLLQELIGDTSSMLLLLRWHGRDADGRIRSVRVLGRGRLPRNAVSLRGFGFGFGCGDDGRRNRCAARYRPGPGGRDRCRGALPHRHRGRALHERNHRPAEGCGTHAANMVLSAPTAKRLFDSNPLHHDTYLLTLPLFHSSGQTVTMNAGLSVGATLVLMPRFEAEAALDPMLAEPVTVFAGGLKFATTVGIHSGNIGVPILMEKVERRCGTGG